MSMLTPPGMGGQYRITGDKYPRMRRGRRRSRIVLAVVASAAALGLIGWGTLELVDVFSGGGRTSAAGPGAACTPSATPTLTRQTTRTLPQPARIKVNVYNATPRGGLAKQTADELEKRGFTIGDVGNASKEFDQKVKGAGILLGPTSAAEGALPVLATQLPGAERRTDAARTGTDVDLIIGAGFTELSAKKDADKALTTLAASKPTPTPSKAQAARGC